MIIGPLAFLAGFVDAVAGGGGLISLPAYLIAGLPVHAAVGTNKVSSAMGSAVAVQQFAGKGYIPWRQSGFYIVCALIGSGLGANLALAMDDTAFKCIMLMILPVTAIYILRSKAFQKSPAPFTPPKTLLIGMACAAGVGAYDGFYGPGSGTFLLLLLTSAAHIRMEDANGISKTISLTTNLTALAIFWNGGEVLLFLGLAAGLCGMAGSALGARYFVKGGARVVKPIMLAVLGIFFARMLSELCAAYI